MPRDPRKTPALPHERIFGSRRNLPGSAASSVEGSQIILDPATEGSLREKLEAFNASQPKPNRLTIGALRAVWRRGAGAFSTTHRPGVSRAAWAMARVNAFLRKASGGPFNPNYIQDDDLLPNSEHEDPKKVRADLAALRRMFK